jgi:hypothetical protein
MKTCELIVVKSFEKYNELGERLHRIYMGEIEELFKK